MINNSGRQTQQSEIFFVLFIVVVLGLMITFVQMQAANAEIERMKRDKKPPIIILPEASGYKFRSGRAELENEFEQSLEKEIVPALVNMSREYNVNVIEVIGHTDGQVIGRSLQSCALDLELEAVAIGHDHSAVDRLTPCSNADLGLLRALSVILFIRSHSTEEFLETVQFKAYSAAQLVLPNGSVASVDRTANAERRRIELRFTKAE